MVHFLRLYQLRICIAGANFQPTGGGGLAGLLILCLEGSGLGKPVLPERFVVCEIPKLDNGGKKISPSGSKSDPV